jgi:hypothetical protein
MKKFIDRIFNLKQIISPIVNQVDYSENGKYEVIKFERKYCKLLFVGQKSYDSEKYIVEMLVNNDELIVANKEIAILRPQIHGTGILKFFLPFDCKLESIYINGTDYIKENDVLFAVTPMNNKIIFRENLLKQNLTKLNKTEINYILDDFSNEYRITFSKIGVSDFGYLKLYTEDERNGAEYLGITLSNYNGTLRIEFYSVSDTFTLAKGDELNLLFENDFRIDINFSNGLNSQKHHYKNYATITTKDVKGLFENSFLKLKLTSNRKKLYQVYSFGHFTNNEQYESILEGKLLFKEMAKKFIQMHLDKNLNTTG